MNWQSAAIPPTIRKPWQVFQEDLEDKMVDCETQGVEVGEEAGARVAMIQASDPYATFVNLPSETQLSYIQVSLTELAAYVQWRSKQVNLSTTTEFEGGWDLLDGDAKAEWMVEDPQEYLAKADPMWAPLSSTISETKPNNPTTEKGSTEVASTPAKPEKVGAARVSISQPKIVKAEPSAQAKVATAEVPPAPKVDKKEPSEQNNVVRAEPPTVPSATKVVKSEPTGVSKVVTAEQTGDAKAATAPKIVKSEPSGQSKVVTAEEPPAKANLVKTEPTVEAIDYSGLAKGMRLQAEYQGKSRSRSPSPTVTPRGLMISAQGSAAPRGSLHPSQPTLGEAPEGDMNKDNAVTEDSAAPREPKAEDEAPAGNMKSKGKKGKDSAATEETAVPPEPKAESDAPADDMKGKDKKGEHSAPEPKAEGEAPVGDAAQHIELQVKDQWGNEVQLKIKENTSLRKLMDDICSRLGLQASQVRFMVDGERIAPDDTAENLGLAPDNTAIEVWAEQLGGGRTKRGLSPAETVEKRLLYGEALSLEEARLRGLDQEWAEAPPKPKTWEATVKAAKLRAETRQAQSSSVASSTLSAEEAMAETQRRLQENKEMPHYYMIVHWQNTFELSETAVLSLRMLNAPNLKEIFDNKDDFEEKFKNATVDKRNEIVETVAEALDPEATQILKTLKAAEEQGGWDLLDGDAKAPSCPEPPLAVNTGLVTPSTAQILWMLPPSDGGMPILGYTVEFAQDNVSFSFATNTTELDHTLVHLLGSTDYQVRVSAFNDNGMSPPSDVCSFTTLSPVAPGEPTGLNVSFPQPYHARFTWLPPLDDGGIAVLDYSISYAKVGEAFQQGEVVAAADPLVAAADPLFGSTNYEFQVHARNAVGMSPGAKFSITSPDPDPPAAPTISAVTDVGQYTATITWVAPIHNGGAPVLGVNVWCEADGKWGLVGYFGAGGANSIPLAGLLSGTKYRFCLQADNVSGFGCYSAPSSVVKTLSRPWKAGLFCMAGAVFAILAGDFYWRVYGGAINIDELVNN